MVWSHLGPKISNVFHHFHTRGHQICTCKYINFVPAYPANLSLQLHQICTCISTLFVPAYTPNMYLHIQPSWACNCVQVARVYPPNLHLQVHQIWTCNSPRPDAGPFFGHKKLYSSAQIAFSALRIKEARFWQRGIVVCRGRSPFVPRVRGRSASL